MDAYSSNDATLARRNQSTTHSQRYPPDRSKCLRPAAAEKRQSPWPAPEGKSDVEPNMYPQLKQPGAGNSGRLGSRPASLKKHDSWQSTQTSNADKWFDDSNKNVRGERGSDYMDGERFLPSGTRPAGLMCFRR